MRKRNQQIIQRINQIQNDLSDLKKTLYLDPDKYEIIAILRDGFSFLGTNDNLGNGDFVWLVSEYEIEEEKMARGIQIALNKLNYMHENKVVLYTDVPITKLTEDYQKMFGILNIEVEEVNPELAELIRSEYVENHSGEK